MLLGISVLLAAIAHFQNRGSSPFKAHWTLLSALFFLMSLDEVARFHEALSGFLESRWVTSGYFHYPWVILAIIFVLILGLVYYKFWLDLPKSTKWLFLTAGVLYIGGAVGLELISGNHASMHGEKNLAFHLIIMIEELLEMAGCLVLISALLRYIKEQIGEIRIRFH